MNILSAAGQFGTHKNTICYVGLIIAVEKIRFAIFCTYFRQYICHLPLNSSSVPLNVVTTDCDIVDIELELSYILKGRRVLTLLDYIDS